MPHARSKSGGKEHKKRKDETKSKLNENLKLILNQIYKIP